MIARVRRGMPLGGKQGVRSVLAIIRFIALVVLVVLVRPTGTLQAGDQTRHRATLAGLGPVHVLVEEISDDLKGSGLSITTLQTDTELRLRAAGIRVATEAESFVLPGAPYLYVNVTGLQDKTVSGRQVGYSANVSVSLVQQVRLDRTPSLRINAPTWSVEEIVTGPAAEIIRRSVRDLVDRFANVYLSVNPK